LPEIDEVDAEVVLDPEPVTPEEPETEEGTNADAIIEAPVAAPTDGTR
jgi:hypothetical protein